MKKTEDLVKEYLELERSLSLMEPLLGLHTRGIPLEQQTPGMQLADRVNEATCEKMKRRMEELEHIISHSSEIMELHITGTRTISGAIRLSTFTALAEQFQKLIKSVTCHLKAEEEGAHGTDENEAQELYIHAFAPGSFRMIIGAPHPQRPLFQDDSALHEADLVWKSIRHLTDFLGAAGEGSAFEKTLDRADKTTLLSAQDFYEEIRKKKVTIDYHWKTGTKRPPVHITPASAKKNFDTIHHYITTHTFTEGRKVLEGRFTVINTEKNYMKFQGSRESLTLRCTPEAKELLLSHHISVLKEDPCIIEAIKEPPKPGCRREYWKLLGIE